MTKYKILIWYRQGKFEKDFEEIEIEAENDEQAVELVKKHSLLIFKAEIISSNETNS